MQWRERIGWWAGRSVYSRDEEEDVEWRRKSKRSEIRGD
jgi:hypothetical protein